MLKYYLQLPNFFIYQIVSSHLSIYFFLGFNHFIDVLILKYKNLLFSNLH